MQDCEGRRWLAGLAAIIPLLLWGGEDPSAISAPTDALSTPDRVETSAPGRHRVRIHAAGHWWTYNAQVPEVIDEACTWPVVVALHGSGGSGLDCLDSMGWAELAEREGVLIVAPDALPAETTKPAEFLRNPRQWNSGQHPPDRPRSRIDDLAFFDALLDDLASRWPIDPARIHVAGHSNGAAMAFRLAAERAGRIAGIAAVSGLCWLDDPRPARPVPTLLIAGTRDPLLPLDGGSVLLPWEFRETPPFRPNVARWATALGLPAAPARVRVTNDVLVQAFGVEPVAPTPLFRVLLLENHGHHWPGAPVSPLGAVFLGPRLTPINATESIWNFFREHPPAPSLEGQSSN